MGLGHGVLIRTHRCYGTPTEPAPPSLTTLTYRWQPSASSQPQVSRGAVGSSLWHGSPWHVPGLSAGGLGSLRSPGRAGGSGAALCSTASPPLPRQLLNESRLL